MLRKNLLTLILMPVLALSLSSCLSMSENSESEGEIPDETTAGDVSPESDGLSEFAEFENEEPAEASSDTQSETAASDEFAEFENENAVSESPAEQTTNEQAAPFEDDLFEQNEASAGQEIVQTPTPEKTDEFDEFAIQEAPGTSAPQIPESVEAPFNEPAPTVIAAPIETVSAPENEIKSVQFKAYETGGTLVIQADRPMTFTTRKNPDNQQLVVEVSNARLPARLKRPLNMKDMNTAIGAVDAYQESGSSTARFVVQLKKGASSPVVVTEGNTLLVVADPPKSITSAFSTEKIKDPSTVEAAARDNSILTSRSLQEFLAGNTKFYGKKISLETNTMSVRDALRFIAEEGGVNMIIADNVQGNVSLKLRDVPWDQAFIVIMKSKELGYVRQGNVLRVATINDLRKEEDDAITLTSARLKTEPLVVKVFPVNYAKVEDLSGKIKDFLTERGKVAGDTRTNSIVVTDIQENLDRVSQLVYSLDTQPPQVLIEGRIIEATDQFRRQVGINWGFSGGQYVLGQSGQGSVTLRPELTISTGQPSASQLNLSLGSLDVLGDINALISMNELESKVRVLSSPRIVTLSNEKATINQKVSIPIASLSTTPTGTIQTFTFRDMELKLEVTPQITSNASVIMNILVKREIEGPAPIGSTAPSIESREASTKVMVKNGQTSIIGGVYQNDSNDTTNGVPYLKDIPVLGSLFRSKNTTNRRTELMIFLTPRIVVAGFSSPEDDMKPTLGREEGAPSVNR